MQRSRTRAQGVRSATSAKRAAAPVLRPGNAAQPHACAGLTACKAPQARRCQPPVLRPGGVEQLNACAGLTACKAPQARRRPCFKTWRRRAVERVRRTYGLQSASSAPLPPAAGGRPCRPVAVRPGGARQSNACARLTRRMQGAARDWQAALPPCFKARQCSAAERVRKVQGQRQA